MHLLSAHIREIMRSGQLELKKAIFYAKRMKIGSKMNL